MVVKPEAKLVKDLVNVSPLSGRSENPGSESPGMPEARIVQKFTEVCNVPAGPMKIQRSQVFGPGLHYNGFAADLERGWGCDCHLFPGRASPRFVVAKIT
jgi:hypothetical protein